MACNWVKLPDGTTAVLCGGRRKTCSVPGCQKEAARECDFPVNKKGRKSRTCDAPICAQHATAGGEGVDWCPPHARYIDEHGAPPDQQRDLFPRE